MTRPAPPTARLPRCTRCQVCGWPSFAEYWQIGETTILFLSWTSRIRNGSSSFIAGSPGTLLPDDLDSSLSKHRCAHTHFGRTLFNRYFKIVGHSHRQNGQGDTKFSR